MTVSKFKPAWWLPNSHLQTIWPTLCRPSVKIPLQRERVELPDGDFIDLDWIKDQKMSSSLVLILHGLEGSVESHYAKGMLQTISKHGWRGVFMHFRGCSGEPNRLPRGYHSGETADLDYVIQLLLNRFPKAKLAVIGYSLGGNVLLKWLGETNNNNPLKAAAAISVPFELIKAANRIQKGFSKFYQWYFLKYIRQRLGVKFQTVSAPVNASILDSINTIFEFDDKITAPLHGFSSVKDYYTSASSRPYLKSIKVPTLILHAKDDPFMSEDIIPKSDELSPHVKLEITDKGGHVGFVAGKYPWQPDYWLERRIPEFLQECLGNNY